MAWTEKLQVNKEDVMIDKLEPIGNYAVRIVFETVTTLAYTPGNTCTTYVKIIKTIGITIREVKRGWAYEEEAVSKGKLYVKLHHLQ